MFPAKEDAMARRRHELTDAQWGRIEHLLPGKKSDPGRTAADNRMFVDAVVFVLKTGIPWADLPGRYGKPDTVYKRFDRWCAAGVWERIARALGDPDLEEVQLDSMTVKAHPVATTGRRLRGEKKTTPTRVGASAAAAAGSAPRPTPRSTAAGGW
jgi:transposase